ncbi:MAG: NAD-dependent epimerase/dehydratase family protein, partial [Actinomycetota bacterium]|nr:NAD-dependent epimerase/dehydratase family protein [Actinomycetota bacterium]
MDDAERVHVVVGASGGTGRALVRELVRRGRTVRAVNRSGRADAPPGVEVVAADATDPDRMREVCRGAGVVYNLVNPPFTRWREDLPKAVDGTLAGAEAAGARLVFADDTWMYGRVTAPMTEDLPPRSVSDKGVLRAWLAERVLAAHAAGRVRTVVGRAPELYGPAVESVLGRPLFGPAVG